MKHVEFLDGKYHVWCDVNRKHVLIGTREDVIAFFVRVAAARAYESAILLCRDAQPKSLH